MTSATPRYRFNLNSWIRFKLTDEGRAIHRRDWDEMNAKADGNLETVCPYRPPDEDRHGYTEEQAWRFIELYGPYMHPRVNLPVELIIEIAAEDLTKVS